MQGTYQGSASYLCVQELHSAEAYGKHVALPSLLVEGSTLWIPAFLV